MKTTSLAALLSFGLPLSLFSQDPLPTPLLEITSGLPGRQVRLSWPSVPGVRYPIERSADLGGGSGGGGAGGWSRVAMVMATGTETEWLDPQPTTDKAFYRVGQPVAGVYSISPPVLSPTGGELIVHGQLLPAGSFLVLEVDGVPLTPVALVPLGGGMWQATVTGMFAPGAHVIATLVVDGLGTTLVTLNQPLTVTPTGFAPDSPASLPPAPPMPDAQSNPIPGVGIVIKRNPRSKPHRISPGPDDDCDDLGGDFTPSARIRNCMQPFNKWATMGDSLGMGIFAGKKGYDYYMANSDMASTALQSNPYYSSPSNQGQMVGLQANPMYKGKGVTGDNPLYQGSRLKGHKHPDLMKREIGPGATSPSPSGLPGEVSFQSCDISLPCPAGPPLAWISTYRSMVPVNSGHGPGWDFSYNISIEPIPSTAGSGAPRVAVHDGGGRTDIFHRQPDGSYRCDGMFREGSFTGDTFTLTFADTGTWTFKPLDGSPAAGKVDAITDRNGVGLTCDYDPSGLLETVSDEFGRSLSVEWSTSPPRITSVTSTDSLSFNYAKIEYTYTSADDKRASASAPFVPGQPPVAGPTTYTYASGSPDPRQNDNLLSITDGAGRLMEAFTYSAESDPRHLDYDTCATHDVQKSPTTGNLELIIQRVIMPPGATPGGGYTIFEVDELGRLTETDCDRQHRIVAFRQYTGYCTPGVPVTSTSNRPNPATKVRATDPAYFETTCAYNADSHCTRITYPDGSQELVTYDRDFRAACPPREGGNPREISLVAPGGERRTVSQSFQPGFGNPECESPGNPIKGISVKGGRNPGGNIGGSDAISAAERGNLPHFLDLDSDNDGIASLRELTGNGGGPTLADDWEMPMAAKYGTKQKAWLCCNFRTLMVSAHGQVTTAGFDDHGNCISIITSLPFRGKLYQVNTSGQCTGVTVLNGPGSSFHDEYHYNPATGFLGSVVCDSEGLHLTTTFERDAQGRIIRVVGPLLNDSLYAYNPLHQCVQVQSPRLPGSVPYRISTNTTIDPGGRPARIDVEHRAPDGTLDAANPAYSTFHVYNNRGRQVRVAVEERPVDAAGLLEPDPLTIESYAVRDITLDPAGQVSSVVIPAASRAQVSDLSLMTHLDERGMIHRVIEGGLGNPSAVTTEFDYDLSGALVRCATVASGIPSPEVHITYDGFHRTQSVTDPDGTMTTFEYGNDGRVTTSVTGQVPGFPGPLLLSRVTASQSVNDGGNDNWNFASAARSGYTARRRVEVLKSNKTGDPNANRMGNPLVNEVAIAVKDRAASGGGTPVGGGDFPLAATRWSRVKNNASLDVRMAFFGVEVEDDTFIVERFIPGSTVPSVNEVTTVDRSPAGLVQSVTCNGDLLLSVTRDSAGRPASFTDGACTFTPTLDANGNVLICTRTDHSDIPGEPDKTFTVTRVIDALGRCTRTTDGSGNVAHIAFDSLGRWVSSTSPGGLEMRATYDGSSTTGPFSVEISADADGDLDFEMLSRSLVRSGELRSVTNSNGHSTLFTSDASGRPVRTDHPDGTFETTEYDSRGFTVRGTYSDLGTRDITCDSLGRPTSVVWTLPPAPTSVVAVADATYAYDGLGNQVSAQQGTSLITRIFDCCGDPCCEITDGKTVTRTFDHRGRTGITYPDGKQFSESRDALGRLLSITPVAVPPEPPVVVMEYAGHRVVRSTQRNGMVTRFTYRGDGEAPLLVGDASFDTGVRVELKDAFGNLQTDTVVRRDPDQRETRRNDTFSEVADAPGRSKTFTRDLLGRVTGCITRRREVAGGPVLIESEVSYALNLEGRRLSELRGGIPGTYTQSDAIPPGDLQRGRYTTWPGSSIPLDWDAGGNLALFHSSTRHLGFVHDAEGKLVAVTDLGSGTTACTFTHDAAGRRSSMTTGGGGLPPVTTYFTHDGEECVQELDFDAGNGVIDAALTFVSSGGIRHCISTRNGTLYYPHGGAVGSSELRWKAPELHSHQDSVALITNAAGTIVERFDCDDAGKPIFLGPDGLPGTATSSSIGLRWLAPARAWEPAIGMFLSPGGVYSPDLGALVSSQKTPSVEPSALSGWKHLYFKN